MKTPEEIKKGLKCCGTTIVGDRRTTCNAQCPYIHEGIFCRNVLHGDTDSYIVQLESTYSQVSKALCGKENATLDELLQAVDQVKKIQAEAIAIKLELDAVKHDLAQTERERDAAVHDVCEMCYTCKHQPDSGDRCKQGIDMDGCECNACGYYEWRGPCPENTKEDPF